MAKMFGKSPYIETNLAKRLTKKGNEMRLTAKIEKPAQNGKNFDKKELIRTLTAVVNTKDGLKTPFHAKFYMGRSTNASVVYCSLWAFGNNIKCSGHGKAGGYGFHKPSAAMQAALDSAGIKLSLPINGVGSTAMENAAKAIIKAMGYHGQSIIVG